MARAARIRSAITGRFSDKQDAADNPDTTVTESDKVTVNENVDGEATQGTTQEGDTSTVENTDSIPQNELPNRIQTTPLEDVNEADRPIAQAADEARTPEEIAFSNESNPNQKARTASTGGEKYDQDGNLRTDGYSYGVAPDDVSGMTDEAVAMNRGEAPTPRDQFEPVKVDVTEPTYNQDNANVDWDEKKRLSLEKNLSDEGNGVVARVTTASDNMVRVKFYRNNKPLGTYTSRNFKTKDARSHLKDLLANATTEAI